MEQRFPRLSAEQVAELAPFGIERHFEPGAIVWRAGDLDVDFFVVLEGALEIVGRDAYRHDSLFTTLGPGQYSGETSLLAGRRAVVAGRAAARLELLAIPAPKLRQLLVTRAGLGEIVMRSFILRRMQLISERAGDVVVVGSRHSADSQRLLEFLVRNAQPYTFLDLERTRDVAELLHGLEVRPDETPMLVTARGAPLRNPSLSAVAEHLGLALHLDPLTVRDVAVIGAGPAGLAAAVYAASEGLDVVVIDAMAPGGQAGTSSRIENYLGFPTGISGQALAARAYLQAQKFGARFLIPERVLGLACGAPYHELLLEGGERLRARTVVVASGAKYSKLQLEGLDRLEGAGVYRAATFLEAQLCRGGEVAVVGGGNSAGQAAVFLAESAYKVYVIVRAERLASSMSQYLVRRIETTSNIELRTRSEVCALEGERSLEAIRWRHRETGEETRRPVRHLFVFIGAVPNTAFLPGTVGRDSKGFVCTGPDLTAASSGPLDAASWPLERAPFLLESSCPGVFAVGDARAGSTKRVAAAVGEGSTAVQFIHRVLTGQFG